MKQATFYKRDGHTYIFRYERGQEADMVARLSDLAANPELSFDWFDAAVMSFQIGKRLEIDMVADKNEKHPIILSEFANLPRIIGDLL